MNSECGNDGRTLPRDTAADSTLALWRDGYRFIPARCERLDSDVFEARLLLRKVICMRGEAAARLFYDRERFTRQGVMPGRLEKTLFGRGGVQGLEGEAHRRRKRLSST